MHQVTECGLIYCEKYDKIKLMIIDILQTKSIGTRTFNVFYNKNMAYMGNVSAASSLSPCQLLRPDGSVALSTKSTKSHVAHRVLAIVFMIVSMLLILFVAILFPPEENPLPLILTTVIVVVGFIIYATLIDSLFKYKRKQCQVYGLNSSVEFYQQSGGILFMYHVIAVDGRVYKIYDVSKGSMEYLSIYLDDIQIGQINVDISAYQKRNYTIYLLDSHAALGDILSLFALYYHSLNYARRRELSYGKERSWTYSRTNKFYNPSWLMENFNGLL